MKGKNVTTVLLNSSSDDIPSSINMEERVGPFTSNTNYSSRHLSSSSPFLNTDYYPKSPRIVKHHLKNSYATPGNRSSRYENHYRDRRKSTDYLHHDADHDDKLYNNFKGFGGGRSFDTDNSDDYQPVHYGGKSASTNFIDGYGSNKSKRTSNNRIINEEEDEYDISSHNKNNFNKFENQRSKTLERDNNNGGFNRTITLNRTEDFINRSKTLDNRISSLRERSMMLAEMNRRERGGDGYNKSEFDTNKNSNAQNSKITKPKEMMRNIFSTLLRRNTSKKIKPTNNDMNAMTQSSMQNMNSNHLKTTIPQTSVVDNKKSGHNSNFFTSFLEKKRNEKQQHQANVMRKGHLKGDPQNTYQSFGNQDPPSFSVIDYSDRTPTTKPYYGESIDTEDTSYGSDIWKKSHDTDTSKVKRRWTIRESSRPNVIREEEDLTSRTLGRKPGYNSINNSIDRRKHRSYSDDREESYDDRFLKVPGVKSSGLTSRGKYNTVDTRYQSPDKISYSPQRYDKYDGHNNNSMPRRNMSSDNKGYSVGGGGFSSGSESNNNRFTINANTINNNNSLRSVYLHEPAVIPEMPMPRTNSAGGGASLLSGRRTLSKDEISNYSGSRKETKQLSRSMSMAHPWGPQFINNEIDYSPNNSHLPPHPPSRSPSGSLGINSTRQKPPLPGRKQHVSSSSVESLLRHEDTPQNEMLPKTKTSNTKLGRSKSMSVSQSKEPTRNDSFKGNRFSTLWFNKKNSKK